jgi:hypothetical protein
VSSVSVIGNPTAGGVAPSVELVLGLLCPPYTEIVQVIFLGAGASKCAGYPLANGLVPALKEAAATERTFVNFRDDWEIWKDYYGRARGPVKTFLANPNPEVVFSFLDLYDAAKDAVLRGRMAAIKSGDKRPRPRESRQLAEAPRARESLLRCLDWFFAFRHYARARPKAPRLIRVVPRA